MRGEAVTDEGIERETRLTALAGVGARVANAGLAFLTQVLFARMLGAAEYGVGATATALMLVVAGVSTLGLGAMPQRFWPEYAARGDADRLRGLVRFACLGPFVIGIGFALAGILAVRLASPLLSPPVAAAASLAMLAVPAQAALDVVEGIALARGWRALATGFAFVLRPLLVPLIFLAAWLGGVRVDAGLAALALAAATWLAALALVLAMRRRLAAELPRGPAIEERRRWLRAGWPVMLTDLAFLLMTSVDIVLLQVFRDDATVGAYGAAARLVALVAFVQAGLAWASGHHFSALHAAGDRAGLAAYAARTARWTFLPSLAAAAITALAAPLLLMLFGREFQGGAPIVAVLLLGLLARAAVGPAEQLLVMTDNQDSCAYAFAWAFVANVGFAAALIPAHGAIGAAAATAMAYAVAALVLAREVGVRLGFPIHALAGARRGGAAAHA